ncbi:conserved hypothetical protein [Hyella patelloides LEGE 07179]|uniref:Uncharacterized protein n=1 Tax=Hyella patelloides LEGE 07179 TaxID=945734 RepID=A0A563W403_9CYAN|nr:hypothetical protein [Hyella patelloides]VEP18422.1 conserved hypothetical protein [Hyella patelloides LEGE 07179]
MGRKAKLKKQRRQAQQNKSDAQEVNSQDFIGQMRQEGYRLEAIQRSPEVPQENIEPQL